MLLKTLPLLLLPMLSLIPTTLTTALPPRSISTLAGAYTDPSCSPINLESALQPIPATGARMPFSRSVEYGTLGARYIGVQFLANPHKIVFYSDAKCTVEAGPAVGVPIPIVGSADPSCTPYVDMGPIVAVRAWCDAVLFEVGVSGGLVPGGGRGVGMFS